MAVKKKKDVMLGALMTAPEAVRNALATLCKDYNEDEVHNQVGDWFKSNIERMRLKQEIKDKQNQLDSMK